MDEVVTCVWNDWSDWKGDCVTCSQDQTRTRTIVVESSSGLSQCVGDNKETRACPSVNNQKCPGRKYVVFLVCVTFTIMRYLNRINSTHSSFSYMFTRPLPKQWNVHKKRSRAD